MALPRYAKMGFKEKKKKWNLKEKGRKRREETHVLE